MTTLLWILAGWLALNILVAAFLDVVTRPGDRP